MYTPDNIKALAANEDTRELAEVLHDAFCHDNHVDGCGWQYENWKDKIWYSRKDYLLRAEAIINRLVESGTKRENIDFDLLAEVFDLGRKYQS